jgi:hypothetical protein
MAINKAQGNYRMDNYMLALSRGVSRNTTWVLSKPNEDLDPTRKRTKNIVYRDVLQV